MRGLDDMIAEINFFFVEESGHRAIWDTIACVNSTDPTPASIKLTPNVSVFASRRGKLSKSTARIAMHVASIIVPRYDVRKGFRMAFKQISTSWRAWFDSRNLNPEIQRLTKDKINWNKIKVPLDSGKTNEMCMGSTTTTRLSRNLPTNDNCLPKDNSNICIQQIETGVTVLISSISDDDPPECPW